MASPEFPQPQLPGEIYPEIDERNPEFLRMKEEVVEDLIKGNPDEGRKPVKKSDIDMGLVEYLAKVKMMTEGQKGDRERRKHQSQFNN